MRIAATTTEASIENLLSTALETQDSDHDTGE